MKKMWITYLLIGLNVLVFGIVALLSNDIKMQSAEAIGLIFQFGANFNPLALNGEPWRIITCMFLHYGILHLAVNMYSLYNLGSMLEFPIGSFRFFLIYMICGVVASLASLIFGSPYVMSAGASGAIFGLYGYQLGAQLIISYRDGQKLKPILTNFLIFVVINIMIASSLNVDNSAHIGGCLAGLLLSVCHFKLHVFKKEVLLLITLVVLPNLMWGIPNDQYPYYDFYRRFVTFEQYAVVNTNLNTEDGNEAILNGWKKLSEELNTLHVLPRVEEDKKILQHYLDLREKQLSFIKHLHEGEIQYQDSLIVLGDQFKELPPLKTIFHLYMIKNNK